MSIETSSIAYNEQFDKWKMTSDLMDGTDRLREEHSIYLPQYENESNKNYTIRYSQAVLHNAFRKTVRSLTNKPFKKPIVIEGLPTDWTDGWFKNIDRQKTPHDEFARKTLIDMMTFGLAHFLVDFPETDGNLTKEEELKFDIRPYFSRVTPLNIIGWQFQNDVMTELRIFQTVVKQQDDWEEEEVDQVVLWTPNEVVTHEKGKDEKWKIVKQVTNTLGKIPLVTIYTDRKQLMIADSPLEDLAYTNIRHFQSSADQQYILRVARVPFLEFRGYDKQDVSAIVSVSNAFANSNPSSSINWVEIEGQSVGKGQEDLDRLEDRMMSMGAEMLVKARPGHISATEKAIEEQDRISDLQAFVKNLEYGLARGYKLMGEWVKKNIEGKASIFQGFGLSLREKDEVDMLLRARVAREISRDTYLYELKRRNIIEDLDIELEKSKLAIEEPLDV